MSGDEYSDADVIGAITVTLGLILIAEIGPAIIEDITGLITTISTASVTATQTLHDWVVYTVSYWGVADPAYATWLVTVAIGLLAIASIIDWGDD
jgi:hypothetical protein